MARLQRRGLGWIATAGRRAFERIGMPLFTHPLHHSWTSLYPLEGGVSESSVRVVATVDDLLGELRALGYDVRAIDEGDGSLRDVREALARAQFVNLVCSPA